MAKATGLLVLMIFFINGLLYSQTNNEKAESLCIEAVELMDSGKVDESIELLKEAQKLDPENFNYQYEMAYALYLKEDYKGVIKVLEKIKDHKDVSDILFQLLGNSYDMIGKSDKALSIYDAGLKEFPNSGKLYLEKGNIYWGKAEYANALSFYEQGIEMNPGFPSNYYRAAKIYCNSTESVWGILYGEIFMNLERNSDRTQEISKLLFDTYKDNIKIYEDSTRIDFCKIYIDANDILDKDNIKFPFCWYYGEALLFSIFEVKSIDINSLDLLRKKFIEYYYEKEYEKTYPNIIIDYQNQILKAGHLESYNHWILMKGDEDTFGEWYNSNKEKWEDFVTWFSDNGLKIDDSNKFFTGQY